MLLLLLLLWQACCHRNFVTAFCCRCCRRSGRAVTAAPSPCLHLLHPAPAMAAPVTSTPSPHMLLMLLLLRRACCRHFFVTAFYCRCFHRRMRAVAPVLLQPLLSAPLQSLHIAPAKALSTTAAPAITPPSGEC
jgi:hypothetical protein